MKLCSNGFSLIEVMQAMALAALSLVGVSSLLLTTVHANTRAHAISAAATAAQAKIEELRSIPVAELACGSDEATESGAPYRRTWTVSAGPTADSRLVAVRVDGSDPPVELRTIVAD
jgi:prepilin-type N-terminal cleavage/methylation domain-containing protein